MPSGEKALTSLFTSLQHIMSSISLHLLFFFFFSVYRTSLKHWRELSICHFAGFLLSEPDTDDTICFQREKFYVFVIVAIAFLGEYVASSYYPHAQNL
jgi:hypothetical protein